MKLIDNKARASILKIIEYMAADERKHYEESGMQTGHVFEDIVRVESWLNETAVLFHILPHCSTI